MNRIDQFHPTIAFGDATSNDCLELQRLFWSWELRSDLYAARALPELARFARDRHELLTARDQRVLLLHHSIGHHTVDEIAAWPGRKILRYHNITPARYFAGVHEEVRKWCEVGREQLRRLATVCELGIGVSEYNRAELAASGFAKTAVVPILLEWSAFDVAPDAVVARRLADERTAVLAVGQLLPHKGVAELLRAFARYRESDASAHLYVVGSSALVPEHRATLEALAAELGVATQVTFAGSVSLEELVAYYRGASVYVTLSEHEGFGVTVLEAMRFGLPVVAYAAGAIPETAGDATLLLEDRAPETVAAALERAVRDAALRRELVERGKRRLEAFDPARVAERLREVLASDAGLAVALPPRRSVAILTSAERDDARAASEALAAGLRAHGHAVAVVGVRRADNADLSAKVRALPRADVVVIEHEFGIFRELRFVEALVRLRLRGMAIVLALRELEPLAFHQYRALLAAVERASFPFAPLRVAVLHARFRVVARAMGSLPRRLVVRSPESRSRIRILTDDESKVEEIPSLVPPLDTPAPRDAAEKRALRERVGLPADRFVFVSPGYAYAGRRFTEVATAAPEDAVVVCCGLPAETDPGSFERLRAHVKARGLTNVVIEESDERLDAYLRAADCVVLFDETVFQSDNASRAIALGLPCVFSDLPAYRLYEGAGLFASDADELRRAMRDVRDPEVYARLARQTRVLRRMLAPERNAMRYLAGLFQPGRFSHARDA